MAPDKPVYPRSFRRLRATESSSSENSWDHGTRNTKACIEMSRRPSIPQPREALGTMLGSQKHLRGGQATMRIDHLEEARSRVPALFCQAFLGRSHFIGTPGEGNHSGERYA